MIQTISNKAFAALIPDEWVARELDQDYGLDYIIEIFTDGESTSKIFFVQLKGTDTPSVDGNISYQIERAHLDYYNPIPIPILFVIYSTVEQQFWAIWANNLKDIFRMKKVGQKTSRLTLSQDQIITRPYFDHLPDIFSPDLVKKISLTSTCSNAICKLYHEKLTGWLTNFYPNAFITGHQQVTQEINFRYTTTERNLVKIEIHCLNSTSSEYEVNLSDKSFLFLPLDEFDTVHESLASPLFFLGLSLVEKDLKSSLELVTKCVKHHKGSILLENLMVLCKKATSGGEIGNLQAFIRELILVNRIGDATMANNFLFMFTGYKDRNFYRDNLSVLVDHTSNSFEKGMLNYNLANAYMINGDLYEASQYYQRARKLEPDYLNRHYWWKEYGGVLFSTGHFKFAEQFYKRSLELDAGRIDGPTMFALIADCQFFQCSFSEAKHNFDLCLNIEDQTPSNFYSRIKRSVCQVLVDNNLERGELYVDSSIALLEEFLKSKKESKLVDAIDLFPLNGTAWFNLGIHQRNSSEYESAYFSFLTTICIQKWDKEAWANCIFLALNLERNQDLAFVLGASVEIFGIGFSNYLAESIYGNETIPETKRMSLIEAFHKILYVSQQPIDY